MHGWSDVGTPIICNPLPLSHPFQDVVSADGGRVVFREGGDPSVVLFKGRYYLFASMSAGFWYSDDLAHWTFHRSDSLPGYDYAPDAVVWNGSVYLTASRNGQPGQFFRSADPLSVDFELVRLADLEFWDPHMFVDEDDRLYLYWGCSDREPLYGVELAADFSLRGKPVPLLGSDAASRGWETPHERDVRTSAQTIDRPRRYERPWVEGPWMTRHQGRYYLQYAAPVSEFNIYADGYAVGSSPLGPFEYAHESPFSSKPGGFVTGAGRGSTFQDRYGNWWHASTMRISVNHGFERRVGLFPAGFDANGVLFCNQQFADYPMYVHQQPFDPWQESSPGWMLVSDRATATASSSEDGHSPTMAVDEDVRTWWVAAPDDQRPWLSIDLGRDARVNAIQINVADHRLAEHVPRRQSYHRLDTEERAFIEETPPAILELALRSGVSGNAETSTVHSAASPHELVVLDEPQLARFVTVRIDSLPFGGTAAVSGLRVFGESSEGEPSEARITAARRISSTRAVIEWEPSPEASGYTIRWGLSPTALYHSWQVPRCSELDLSVLSAGGEYWVAVDSFSTGGVTPGRSVQIQRGDG